MKLLSNFLYSVKQGIKGIFTNKTMSFISIISVSASLIILGTITSIVLNTNQFIKTTKYEINEIRVSIQPNLDGTSIENLKDKLNDGYGKEGWEVVCVKEESDWYVALLKRKLVTVDI